tara:strand:- start:1972 stop:2355 length:384 start_codon:yes stop_codon:yes gene_type:complete
MADRTTKRWSFDILPATLNKFLRMHWAVKKKYNDNWMLLGIAICGRPSFKPGKAEMTITMHRSRLQDKDNRYGSVKSLVDTFTKLGWIIDDNTGDLALTVKEEKSKRKDQRTEVVLTVEMLDDGTDD